MKKEVIQNRLKLYHKKITEYEKEHVSGINEQSTSRICYGSAVNPFL